MRRKSVIAFLLAAVLALASCGSVPQTETDTETTVPQTQEQTDIQQAQETGVQDTEPQQENIVIASPPTDYVSDEEMQLADMWQKTDESAIAKVMKKAAEGEKVTVAVIGGSITQGTISSGSSDSSVNEKRCYADIFFSWWKETFPQTEFECINAGIGATDSYIGVHRLQSDVLDYKPDIVLVEFAVNDSNTIFYKKTYDNLVRMIAKAENEPAVLLLFMAQTNGATAQENQAIIGASYGMPMLSYGNVMKEMINSGKYSDSELSGDVVHPSALGHAIAGEIIWKYLNSIYEHMDEYKEPESLETAALTKDCYANARIVDSTQIEPAGSSGFEKKDVFYVFPNNWTCEEGSGEICFTAEFANLGVLYYRQVDGNGGQYEVYVDGNMEAVLDADFKDGWGNCAEAQSCYSSDEVKEHEIIIRAKEDSTGNAFTILGLMLSDGAE
ncbi:MAG: SGNH/GDSL hydrolase family protein [Butyrivibrio sp.]|nr:SGNH/GDSL hydrolase family protein [Butyrivibrio sp.]